MKKHIALVFACLIFLGGCAGEARKDAVLPEKTPSPAPAAEEPAALRVWGMNHTSLNLASLLGEYIAQNPGLAIEHVSAGDMDGEEALESCDILCISCEPGFGVAVYGCELADWIAGHKLADLGQWEATGAWAAQEELLEGAVSYGSAGGVLYALPYAVCPAGWSYEKEAIDGINTRLPEAGWTWEDALDLCLQTGGQMTGFVTASGTGDRRRSDFPPFLMDYLVNFSNLEAVHSPFAAGIEKITLDTPLFRTLIEKWRAIVAEGWHDTPGTLRQGGLEAFLRAQSEGAALLCGPAFDAEHSATVTGGGYICVSALSQRQAEAADLLGDLFGKAQNLCEFSSISATMPAAQGSPLLYRVTGPSQFRAVVSEGLFDASIAASLMWRQGYMEVYAGEMARLKPCLVSPAMRDVLETQTARFMDGELTTDEYIAALEEELNALLYP